VTEGALDALYALVTERVLGRQWMKMENGAIGGSLEWLKGTASGESFRVLSRITEPEAVALVYAAIKVLVPGAIWIRLMTRREQYERDYEEV
jgi:hypothetical protein